ncbi:MAG: helix-turn-helix transcriptional regulator [Pseudomonadales bacterium]|nr:helix-turn-helix transcriptional regulator [Pseudomonadales bacterium]
MTITILKRLRLNSDLTQKEAAKASGVTQPTYQRWESGKSVIPADKAVLLAESFAVTTPELYGKKAPFSIVNFDAEDKRHVYYGEASFHFCDGSNLLATISEAEFDRFTSRLDTADSAAHMVLTTLNNRTLLIRSDSIMDIHFHQESIDTFGPEDYKEQGESYYPDMNFWVILDNAEDPDYLLEMGFSQEAIDEAINDLLPTEEAIQKLLEGQKITAEKRKEMDDNFHADRQILVDLAEKITWSMSEGPNRSDYLLEDYAKLASSIELIEDGLFEKNFLHLPFEGWYRSAFVNLRKINYISFPTHKLELAMAEVWTDSEEELQLVK